MGRGGRELGWEGSGIWGRLQRPAVSTARGGWFCLRRPEPVSDALVFSRGLKFRERVEDLGSLSPQGN